VLTLSISSRVLYRRHQRATSHVPQPGACVERECISISIPAEPRGGLSEPGRRRAPRQHALPHRSLRCSLSLSRCSLSHTSSPPTLPFHSMTRTSSPGVPRDASTRYGGKGLCGVEGVEGKHTPEARRAALKTCSFFFPSPFPSPSLHQDRVRHGGRQAGQCGGRAEGERAGPVKKRAQRATGRERERAVARREIRPTRPPNLAPLPLFVPTVPVQNTRRPRRPQARALRAGVSPAQGMIHTER